jgi:hypothetical protein
MLTPEEQKEIQEHSRAIAKILYKHTEPERLSNLGQIEAVVREGLQEQVMPEIGIFLLKMSQPKKEGIKEKSKV